MARPAPDRDIEHLHPAYRAAVGDLYDELGRRGLRFRMHEGYRGRERQEDGKKRGKSKAGFLQSMHNYGLASDFVGDVSGVNPWDNSHDWEAYGECVEAVGLEWSGRWKTFRELVHNGGRGLFNYSRGDLYLGALADVRNDAEWRWLKWWLGTDDMAKTSTRIACLQRILIWLGGDPGAVDGIWGRHTENAMATILAPCGIDTEEVDLSGAAAQAALLSELRDLVTKVCE